MISLDQNAPTFVGAGFPGGVKMVLRRLDSVSWSAIAAASARAAATIREGSVLIDTYGFGEDEMGALADPSNWKGIAEFITAVEIGKRAIVSWEGIAAEGGPAPVTATNIVKLMRDERFRKRLMVLMDEEGARFLAEYDEGNASAPSPNGSSAGARNTAGTADNATAAAQGD